LWCCGSGDVPKRCGMCKERMCRDCTRGKVMCDTCDTVYAEARRNLELIRPQRVHPPESE
jgi:hypothetical protein